MDFEVISVNLVNLEYYTDKEKIEEIENKESDARVYLSVPEENNVINELGNNIIGVTMELTLVEEDEVMKAKLNGIFNLNPNTDDKIYLEKNDKLDNFVSEANDIILDKLKVYMGLLSGESRNYFVIPEFRFDEKDNPSTD